MKAPVSIVIEEPGADVVLLIHRKISGYKPRRNAILERGFSVLRERRRSKVNVRVFARDMLAGSTWAARAAVTKAVPEYAIMAGVPVRMIGDMRERWGRK
jgi:hypothetical protein